MKITSPFEAPTPALHGIRAAALHILENGDSPKIRREAQRWHRGEVSDEILAQVHFGGLLGLKKIDFANESEALAHANKWAAEAKIKARATSCELDAMRRTTSFTVAL